MEEPAFDRDLLARYLQSKMDTEDKSIRAAAAEIGCSAATLARMLKGSAAKNFPAARNIFQAVSWLGKSITDFEPGTQKESSTLADVEMHLRALKELSTEDREALVAMVKALYDRFEVRSKEG